MVTKLSKKREKLAPFIVVLFFALGHVHFLMETVLCAPFFLNEGCLVFFGCRLPLKKKRQTFSFFSMCDLRTKKTKQSARNLQEKTIRN